MAVIVGSARIDENGKAHGGKSGDQNGREVSTQAWYKHKKGWRVFRCKNAAKAEKIAHAMEAACKNNHIGYDQYQRDTLYNAAKGVGFDPAQVATNCETDCSALVRVCCAYAGIMVGNIRTTNEAKALLASGEFTELKGTKYTDQSAYLRRGDILVTRTQGHTVVVLSTGAKAEASATEATGDKDSGARYVVIVGGNCYIRAAPNTSGAKYGVAHAGEKYKYGGETSDNGWKLIEYNGRTAWVSGKYGKLEG